MLMGIAVCFSCLWLDKSRHQIRGVAPAYISAVALLFGLYSTVLTNNVWHKLSSFEQTIIQHETALRSVLRLIRSYDPANKSGIESAVYRYLADVQMTEFTSKATAMQLFARQPFGELYKLVVGEDLVKDAVVKSHLLSELESARRSRIERIELQKRCFSCREIAILFVFGLMTQCAIALSHAGQDKAMFASVALFSVAFTASIYVLTVFDSPSETLAIMAKMPLMTNVN